MTLTFVRNAPPGPPPAAPPPDLAERLRTQLASDRALLAARREDDRVRRSQAAEHRRALADVAESDRTAARARRDRERDAAEQDNLTGLYRRAARSGVRARIRADIQRSAEMRALRVARVQSVTLIAGVPVLVAFGAWSTTGVQAGVARLLGLTAETPAWWASWLMEPALITIVALIIIGRSVLRSSGGDTDWRADLAEWTALSLSLALNVLGGWHGGLAGLPQVLPHSIGPLGAAGTAFLVGLFVGYAVNARPWLGAPHLADLDLIPGVPIPVEVALPPAADPTRLVPVPTVQDEIGQYANTRPGPDTAPDVEATPPADDVADTSKPATQPKRARKQPTTVERIGKLRERHPDLPVSVIAKRLRVSERTVTRHLRDLAQATNNPDTSVDQDDAA
jgi:hypothetical protein